MFPVNTLSSVPSSVTLNVAAADDPVNAIGGDTAVPESMNPVNVPLIFGNRPGLNSFHVASDWPNRVISYSSHEIFRSNPSTQRTSPLANVTLPCEPTFAAVRGKNASPENIHERSPFLVLREVAPVPVTSSASAVIVRLIELTSAAVVTRW